MATKPVRIDFEQFMRDPQRVFDLIRERNEPVLVARNGELYRLDKEGRQSIWEENDPERARRGMRRAVGALAGVDVEELLADLRAQRGQDSQGRPA